MEINEQDLLHQLYKLDWLLRRYIMQQRRDRGPMGDPYRGQGRILSLLKLKPEISQKDLANILDIRSQSLGELLAKLERQGLITRTPSETDRRVMDIRLTESGRAASEKDEEPSNLESFFDCLNEEEQNRLNDYMGRLNKSLEEKMAAGGSDASFGPRRDFRSRGLGDPFRDERGRPPFDFGGFDPSNRDDFQAPFGGRGPGAPSGDEE